MCVCVRIYLENGAKTDIHAYCIYTIQHCALAKNSFHLKRYFENAHVILVWTIGTFAPCVMPLGTKCKSGRQNIKIISHRKCEMGWYACFGITFDINKHIVLLPMDYGWLGSAQLSGALRLYWVLYFLWWNFCSSYSFCRHFAQSLWCPAQHRYTYSRVASIQPSSRILSSVPLFSPIKLCLWWPEKRPKHQHVYIHNSFIHFRCLHFAYLFWKQQNMSSVISEWNVCNDNEQ